MNRFIIWSSLFLGISSYSPHCAKERFEVSSPVPDYKTIKVESSLPNPSYRQVYTLSKAAPKPSRFTKKESQALHFQSKLLKQKRRGKKNFTFGDVSFSREDLKRTVEQLENWNNSAIVPFSEYFDTYIIAGKQNKGKVLFTGYYSPILKVSDKQSQVYPYPIYTRPEGVIHYPSRREIYAEKALEGKGLELAYAKSLIDIQIMQLQGSGYVEYENGEQFLFSYGGSNLHPRKSIQRYFKKKYAPDEAAINMHDIRMFLKREPEKLDEILFHNPSYIFFIKNPKGKKANGSGNVPLTPHISIATDKRYLPTGACFLAELPFSSHVEQSSRPRLLLAQDVGGGIKGHGRLDLYTGVGNAGRNASRFKDYGQLWLILAK